MKRQISPVHYFFAAELILFITALTLLSFRNHELYQTFAWDIGFFDQLIWQASQGKLNFISTIGNINLIGDHFQPILFLLAPLYWIWEDVRIILIAQSILVSLAAIPIYLLALKKLRSGFLSLSIATSYLLFIGTQFTITNEFHQSAFIPLLLSLGIYWVETKKEITGLFFLFTLIFVKEETALLLAALGLTYILRKQLKIGALLLSGGLISFFFLVYILIPKVSSQGRYIHFGLGIVGDTPIQAITSIISEPVKTLTIILSPDIKLKQIRNSLMSFGGIPLFSPTQLIPIAQQYVVRFIDTRNTHRWLDRNHYAAPLGPLLALATITSLTTIKNKMTNRKKAFLNIAALYLFVSALTSTLLLRGPIINIVKSQIFFTPQWVKDANNLVAQIPNHAKVAANNSLVPHLTHRDSIYLLPEIKDAEYIAIDLAPGPNKYAPIQDDKMQEFLESLSDDWSIDKQVGKAILLKRNSQIQI